MRNGDIAIVQNHIDPFLYETIEGKKTFDRAQRRLVNLPTQHVIVDDGALPNDHVMMKGSMSDTALLLQGMPDKATGSPNYWMEYGRRIAERFRDGRPMGIRCDSCTALAFYLLRTHGCSGQISVIEQAEGKSTGHWFLLVGAHPEELLAYPNTFPRGSFVVDLWGVGVKRQRGENQSNTSVLDPPSCVYSCGNNQLKVKVSYPGWRTLPSKKLFKGETYQSGWFGDKWRSSKLKTLDGKLEKFHKGQASVQDVRTAFATWVQAKEKKYSDRGGATQSMRITQDLLDAFRDNFRWVSG